MKHIITNHILPNTGIGKSTFLSMHVELVKEANLELRKTKFTRRQKYKEREQKKK